MNFVFISPNYPEFFHKFCTALKKKGVCVLGIGDSAFVRSELMASLTEYFVTPDMTNFDALETIIRKITAKYGEIGGIDSINEFWLESESRLRENFAITGASGELMRDYKFKSRMKSRFALANVSFAPWIKSNERADIIEFAIRTGYPLFCKPDNGVGAEKTHKLRDNSELTAFLDSVNFGEYIFEPYIDGELYSFDGLCDKDGELVFCASHRFYTPIDKLIESGSECVYRTLTVVPEKLYKAGLASIKAFELKNSFFHIEFFELNKALGDIPVGEFVALEANMRIAGGYTAEMLCEALGLDIYGLWASVINGEKPQLTDYTFGKKREVINVSRKNGHKYMYSTSELKEAYPQEFVLCADTAKDDNPFGNCEIIASFDNEERLNSFVNMATAKAY